MALEELFAKLYACGTEEDVDKVVSMLTDNSFSWHPYGDNESFFGVIENQQASAVPALIEKLTNSIDAIMMRKCIESGINPRSSNAPKSVDEAVQRFFPESDNWDLSGKRKAQAESIQVIADGPKKNTSLIIYDDGEGQHPSNFRNTFLSLLRGNKNEIHFVQGKYNMGGSGAIVFCGKQRYQLIASRRFDNTGSFGFTLIRKHPLSQEEKRTKKNTWYEYLLFESDIPSFTLPESGIDLGLKNRFFKTGTIIKLYSYNLPSGSRSVISRDLNQSINEYLFNPALPIYTIDNKERYPDDRNLERESFGLKNRLKDNNKYISDSFSEQVNDTEIGSFKIAIYIFKHRIDKKSIKESKETIRREFFKNNMSVLFSLNGQVHGNYTSEFITRSLKFNLLKDYILVHVDCTHLKPEFRSELFMASRDRLKNGEESSLLRKKLTTALTRKGGRLDEIYKKRKSELSVDTESPSNLLKDFGDKLPLDPELMQLIKNSINLENKSKKKSKPKTKEIPSEKGGSKEKPFSPKRYPTTLKINTKSSEDGIPLIQIPLNGEKTISFSTDVEDQYFDRTDDPGELKIALLKSKNNEVDGGDDSGQPVEIQDLLDVTKSSPTDGQIRVNIAPKKNVNVGDNLTLNVTLTSPDVNLEQIFIVKILDKQKKQETKAQKFEDPSFSGLPKMIEVYKEPIEGKSCWSEIGFTDFDYERVMYPFIDDDKLESIYINMDSTIIRNYIGKLRSEDEIIVAKNRYISSIYFHTLFLYLINKNKKIEIRQSSSQEEYPKELELPDYLMDIFDSSYANFLLNFEISSIIDTLGD